MYNIILVRRMSSEYLHMAISSRCIDETVEFGEVEELLLNTDWYIELYLKLGMALFQESNL